MKKIIIYFLLFAGQAHAETDIYGKTFTCTGDNPVSCVRDGLTVTNTTKQGAIATLNSLQPGDYNPPPKPPIVLTTAQFVARFTAQELAGLTRETQWQPLVNTRTSIAQNAPGLFAFLMHCAQSGEITQARVVQVMNFSVVSP